MNGSTGAPAANIPWQEATTPDGRTYYFKAGSTETQWDKPIELMTHVERALVDMPWQEFKSPDGKPYWHNPQSKETTWVMPEEIKNLKRLQEAQPPRPLKAPPAAAWAAGPTSLPSYNNRNHDRDDYHSDRRDRDRDRDRDRERDREAGYLGGDRPTATFGSSTEILFSNPQDAEEAFNKLLKKLNVQSDWSWPQAIRAGIKDPHWRAIPDPKDREAAFKSYCDDLRAQDKAKEQDRQAKLRDDFIDMLRSHPQIKYYTRWRTALPMIENEAIFRSAKNDGERRILFEEYIASLKRAQAQNEAQERKSALDDLASLLPTLKIEPFTRWHAAEGKLQNSDEFADEQYRSLSKVDVLNTFERHIRELQRQLNEKVQADRRTRNRLERQNRDAYVKLLRELQDNGRLRAGTKWKEVHELIHDDERYIAMLGQPGSSPLDLFWDTLEQLDGKFRTQRRHALEVLETQRFEVTTATSFENFLEVMRNDSQTSALDEQSLKAIFAYVIGKVKKREDDERRDSEHHERRAMDDFRSALKHLEPPILASSTWDETRPRVEKTEEYRAVKSDANRRSVFDKYIRRLDDKKRDRERDRDRDRERSRRDPRDRERDRDRRDRDREYRNGRSDRRTTRTRSPEFDPYAEERRQAQEDREARYRVNERTGLSPPFRRLSRDENHHDRPRRGSGDHYGRERREREAERERTYVSRADPLESAVSVLDYGDTTGRPSSLGRRRRESDESSNRRDPKRPRFSPHAERAPKSPAVQLTTEIMKEDTILRSGSEEGEIEED
ncbi:U1 snRNP-associated protein Usp104 [Dendryphion nanum]|uniref:U1 snRNP-associated protein Usp104 n=1 Tax=Dendryphion nanum TaxID=256645 RepID=A0A9P9IRP8_9PLEO|nr:U1 snRNP-associated protein Usp104 [Dendryphion nanum]